MDIGESLVGAYFRQIRGCHSVAFNTFLGHQAELDVIGVANEDGAVRVWMAEVAIHLEGLNYGGYEASAKKVAQKVAAARAYAAEVYPAAQLTVEFWSPVVPSGLVTMLSDVDVNLVVNGDFTEAVNELASHARTHTRLTGDDAFRFLQLLTHLRGRRPDFPPTEG